ncbi:MAG: isochorismatase family protein [Planctomycetes bacterium]|nr:isochorismatase family protein [Planctomycetota bacterium]
MPLLRMHPSTTALLVVDIQDRLLPTIHAHDAMIASVRGLIQGCTLLEMPVIVTEQYVRGLGHTCAAISQVLPAGAPVFEKMAFSALTPDVVSALRAARRTSIIVCGIEAHVCVLQTVLDCCASGLQAFHATDAISAGQPDQIEPAFRRMERVGSTPTGAISALYELMHSCEHPAFKRMLPIAKDILAMRRGV